MTLKKWGSCRVNPISVTRTIPSFEQKYPITVSCTTCGLLSSQLMSLVTTCGFRVVTAQCHFILASISVEAQVRMFARIV